MGNMTFWLIAIPIFLIAVTLSELFEILSDRKVDMRHTAYAKIIRCDFPRSEKTAPCFFPDASGQ